MERVKQLIEKLMVPTIVRGLMWAIGLLLQLPLVADVQVDQGQLAELQASLGTMVSFGVGTAIEVVALWWSRRKDMANKAAMPPVSPHSGAKL